MTHAISLLLSFDALITRKRETRYNAPSFLKVIVVVA